MTSSEAEAQAAVKWEPFLDDDGNLYFYNHITGESVWELPPEGEHGQHPPSQDSPLPNHGLLGDTRDSEACTDAATASWSPYAVATGVVETAVKLVDAVEASPEKTAANSATMAKKKKKTFMSPAAESRRRRNDAKAQARTQRLHATSVSRYMKLVLPPVALDEGAECGESMDADADPRNPGSLFSAQDSEVWQHEADAERARERRASRRQRQQHKKRVRSLKQQQLMLLQLRTELTRHLLSEIHCSPELLKQKILLLSSQTPSSLLATSRLEPEIAEKLAAAEQQARKERLAAIQAAFELLDLTKSGAIRLVSIITGIFAHEAEIQQCSGVVKGLGLLLSSPQLQQFIISFESLRPGNCHITLPEFRELLSIIEDAWDYYTRIKIAVEDAENDIDAAIEAAALRPGAGVARTRMGFVSKKKAEHELALLQERAALLRTLSSDKPEEMLQEQKDSLIEPVEDWEKDHHHRFIQVAKDETWYCCLCRRRQWQIARDSADEAEQQLRDKWPNSLEIRLKETEVRMAGGNAGVDDGTETTAGVAGSSLTSPIGSSAKGTLEAAAVERDFVAFKLATLTDDSDLAVLEVLNTLLVVIESMSSEHRDQRDCKLRVRHRIPRRRKKQTAASSALHRADPETGFSAMQIIEQELQAEELARRAMTEEERAVRIELERFRRRQERPHLRLQESANNDYVRMLACCVNLPPLLTNLRFDRCLSLALPQKMVLRMVDGSSADVTTPLVLYTLPHRSESDAHHHFEQLRALQQRIRSPFVADMRLVDNRNFQHFAASGMLIECWSVQFVATEFFPRGSWLDRYRQWIHEKPIGDTQSYARIEQHVLAVFRDVAAGISSMHSLGILHLNIKADNIYICSEEDDSKDQSPLSRRVRVKIGGFLAWKAGYDHDSLAQGDVLECMHFNYAPPEALDRCPITPKADVWMLGCAIFDALLLWQRAQLAAVPPNASARHSPIVFSSRSVHDLLLLLPLATSSAVRSLLRMLLQPGASARPDMSQVVEYISFAGVSRS